MNINKYDSIRQNLPKDCKSNHETMTNDDVAESLLLTFD